MSNPETEQPVAGRTRPVWLLAAALLAACGGPATSSATAKDVVPDKPEPKEDPVMKPVLLAMTSHDKKGDTGESTGAYLPEIAHPYAVFTRAGLVVEFASVRGGRVPLDGIDRADAVNAAFLDDPEATRRLHESLPSSAVDPSRYAAIFFAGGHGAMWDLPDDPSFVKATARIYEAGGVVGAVCHGPAALVNVRLSDGAYLVAGKQVNGFTNEEERAVKLENVVPFLLEDRLVARGGRFVGAPKWQKQVVVDGRLVTGQNPASAAGVAEAIVTLLRKEKTP
ncbi:type 1 glutamine amidotransferase domain-containing protein [Polyangium sorediatum]|uniref:Type 1 glutamine amidotransferase domain-containing protein n=2 Tax=Polyangium sorediatum TaxID=889274 RepID=A0ABT6NIX2_9BACT|nr:type 1 glutamine amidotransferase domain-containing protein [Polyangium sorediatum]MDI1428251.1 type 1 glutamine amidotransferase domain-containing protein [Polyangium sorediatum]